ncbi:hypothetical protein RF11_01819 [Thelohanellus kitauei]|uniref:Uncharacterized protein n=1 Tax=Thelohanellus kitauei TaxID=669202 RepID=A0A0C2MT66_THEKT|nr:hypothetical protein RF11_01819 [Thelohanellus kitauei]
MAKEGSSSYKDDEIRTESVTSISTEELASRVLTQSSKTDKNELSAQQKQMQAIGSNSKYRTNNYHGKSSLKTTKWPKSQDSKQTTVSVNSDSVLTNDEIVEASKAKLQFLGNVDLKDLFLFFLMIVAVAIMVIEIKSRRKISRQLRNYLFHV